METEAEVRYNVKQALEHLVIEELTPLGLELVELKLGGSNGRPVIDVRVDRVDGQKITVGECAVASRAIEARLEAKPDLVTSRYVLEVSSPGMERPLRKAAEWKRFVGRSASINSPALGGRHELVIVAVEGPDGAERLRLKDGKGVEQELALADVSDARLVFTWKP
jgi:ribosome maturation factor RimP